jgi:hypothetical protein
MNAWLGGVNPVAVRWDCTRRSLDFGSAQDGWRAEASSFFALMLAQADPGAAAILVDELDATNR